MNSQGIFIDPNKPGRDLSTVNYIYLNHNQNRTGNIINLFAPIELTSDVFAKRGITRNKIIETLNFLEISKDKPTDDKKSINSPNISAYQYLKLPNHPKWQRKKELIEKQAVYRLMRREEDRNWWFIQNRDRGKWGNLPMEEQNYVKLMQLIAKLSNPKDPTIETIDDDWVILIDNNLSNQSLIPPNDPNLNNLETLKVGDKFYLQEDRKVFRIIKEYPSEEVINNLPPDVNKRVWTAGQVILNSDEIYMQKKPYNLRNKDAIKKIGKGTLSNFYDNYKNLNTVTEISQQIRADIQNTTDQDIRDDLHELETKITNQPKTLWLWTKSTTGGTKKKSVRKHRGIHQTGGSSGKLKKGYKYSGKRLKNGKPQIIKIKRK